ncbi:transglycosylase SLT domain-containing protein [Streptomyces sp. J2-1]|uniref:transglycosylase SLT domain-containing protein n=1 Tax=Streptomyces corallincola TaxID=2851888 RepID=UPI001C38A0F6|nr:transglycosylase SLT domain-containing protein [Streptomyces corallincola]MBV2355070.1 transglycosylase SLT domain-containing protein [Streptomyces corallincola]
MPKNFLNGRLSQTLTKRHKAVMAGAGTLGAAAIALTATVGSTGATVTAGSPVADTQVAVAHAHEDHAGLTNDRVKLDALAAKQKAAKAAEAAKTAKAADAKKKADTAAALKKAAADAAAKRAHSSAPAANRSAKRLPMQTVAATTYSNNLDGWIRNALAIMHSRGIPGSYSGLHRNIMRESSGNPMAINNWDINAINGIPSKGLLQVIPPTFAAYHVPGTSWDIYNPVANITAAANYAAHRYGSIDNVNSAY